MGIPVPTEILIMSSVTPESVRSCSESCSWVVDQGWIASVFESPTLEKSNMSVGIDRTIPDDETALGLDTGNNILCKI